MEAVIVIENLTNQPIRNLEILDENPRIFTHSGDLSYELQIDNDDPIVDREYTLHTRSPVVALIDLTDTPLLPGETMEIRYLLDVRTFEY